MPGKCWRLLCAMQPRYLKEREGGQAAAAAAAAAAALAGGRVRGPTAYCSRNTVRAVRKCRSETGISLSGNFEPEKQFKLEHYCNSDRNRNGRDCGSPKVTKTQDFGWGPSPGRRVPTLQNVCFELSHIIQVTVFLFIKGFVPASPSIAVQI